MDCLSYLTEVGKVNKEEYIEVFKERSTPSFWTIVVVDVSTDWVVGTGTILYERKF